MAFSHNIDDCLDFAFNIGFMAMTEENTTETEDIDVFDEDYSPDIKSGMIDVCDGKFKMDAIYKSNLDIAFKRNRKDFDSIFIYSGKNRTGKSTKCSQDLYYLAQKGGLSFGLDNVAYSAQEFKEMVKKAPQYSCIMYDEARRGFNIARTMSDINQSLMSCLYEIAFKNLYIGIVLPRFFDLMKDLAIDRSLCLINCMVTRNLGRGHFGFYNENKKEYLWVMKEKKKTTFATFGSVKPNFYGRFVDWMPWDSKEYEIKKMKFIENAEEQAKDRWRERYNLLVYNVYKYYGINQHDLALFSGLQDGAQISQIISKQKDFEILTKGKIEMMKKKLSLRELKDLHKERIVINLNEKYSNSREQDSPESNPGEVSSDEN